MNQNPDDPDVTKFYRSTREAFGYYLAPYIPRELRASRDSLWYAGILVVGFAIVIGWIYYRTSR